MPATEYRGRYYRTQAMRQAASDRSRKASKLYWERVAKGEIVRAPWTNEQRQHHRACCAKATSHRQGPRMDDQGGLAYLDRGQSRTFEQSLAYVRNHKRRAVHLNSYGAKGRVY